MEPLRLPRRVEDDPRAAHLARELAARAQPLWRGGAVRVARADLTPDLESALKSARSAGRIVRSLEHAERALADDERGLRRVDRKTGVERGRRVSRLLVLADDGSERFYREVESLLRQHAPRVLALRLSADQRTLGKLLFGPDQVARLLLVEHKDAVSAILLALAARWSEDSLDPDQTGRLQVMVFADANDIAAAAAREIAELVQERGEGGRPCVLGLAAGATPVAVYGMLVRLHGQGLSFANVVTFNLDEYYPMQPSSPHSYSRFMRDNLLDHLDLDPASIHGLDGSIPGPGVAEHCEHYERAITGAGGIDLQLLGIGRNGHIGFNEPGSSRTSGTRLVSLNEATRRDAEVSFGEDGVPQHAITMGIGSILRARRVLLLAAGNHKATIVARAVEGAVTDEVPASFLQEHPHASVYLDRAAAESLSRVTQTRPQTEGP